MKIDRINEQEGSLRNFRALTPTNLSNFWCWKDCVLRKELNRMGELLEGWLYDYMG